MIPSSVFQTLIENVTDGFLIVDSIGRLRFANAVAKSLLLLQDGGVNQPLPESALNTLGKGYSDAIAAANDASPSEASAFWQISIANMQDESVWYQCCVHWVEHDHQRYCCLQLGNINLYRRNEERWRELAHTDFVSGLSNRRHFQTLLDVSPNDVRCLGMIDIDHLKSINDKFGHLVGDKAIRFVSERLRESFANAGCIARLGGEEFGVLLFDGRHDPVEAAFESFRLAVQHGRVADSDLLLTVSIGIAFTTSKQSAISELMHCADQALYEAKRSGRNQLRVFS